MMSRRSVTTCAQRTAREEVEEPLEHADHPGAFRAGRLASARSRSMAWRVARTSCTRRTAAPARAAKRAAAIEAPRRAVGPALRIGDREERFAARAHDDGNAQLAARFFPCAARSAALCRAFFANPSPGSIRIASGGSASPTARSAATRHSAITSVTTSPYASSGYALNARSSLIGSRECISTSAAPFDAHTPASPGSRKHDTSFTAHAPASRHARRHRGARRIDRHARACIDRERDHVEHPGDLLGGWDTGGAPAASTRRRRR